MKRKLMWWASEAVIFMMYLALFWPLTGGIWWALGAAVTLTIVRFVTKRALSKVVVEEE